MSVSLQIMGTSGKVLLVVRDERGQTVIEMTSAEARDHASDVRAAAALADSLKRTENPQ